MKEGEGRGEVDQNWGESKQGRVIGWKYLPKYNDIYV